MIAVSVSVGFAILVLAVLSAKTKSLFDSGPGRR